MMIAFGFTFLLAANRIVAQFGLDEDRTREFWSTNSLMIRFEKSWFNDEDCGIDRIPLEPLDCFDNCFDHEIWSERREKMERNEELSQIASERPSARISGGEDTVSGQFPWTAMINRTGYRNWCTGSLLTRRLILSAAHCFWNGDVHPSDKSLFRAWIGVDPPERDRLIPVEIEEIISHPCYPNGSRNDSDPLCPNDIHTATNDLALLVIKPVDIQKNDAYYRFNTICYPNQDRAYDIYDSFLTSGWGRTTDPQDPSQTVTADHLQWAELAARTYRSWSNLINYASGPGRSPLPGDSGGPVFVRSCDGRYYQLAVHQTSDEGVSILHPVVRRWILDVVNRTLV